MENKSALSVIRAEIGDYDVQGPFLPVVEKYIGYPLTPLEFVNQGIPIIHGQDWPKRMPTDLIARMVENFSLIVLSNLSLGKLEAFVENPKIGKWFRIPPAYWLCWAYLPEQLELVEGNWPGFDRDLVGMPIVLWREVVKTAFLGFKAEMEAVAPIACGSPNPIATPSAKQSPGRPEGTGNYPNEGAIVARIIRMCDDEGYVGKGRVQRAIKAISSEIEPPHLDDTSKVRRVRPKVLKLRPDLAD